MGIVVALLLVIGASYAFFALTLRGEKELTVTTGTLSLQYKDQNAIQLEKTYPLSDQEGMELIPYEFSVENTGDIKALYDIILEENEENTLNAIWLKYSLKRNEEEWSSPKKISSLKLEEGLEVEPGKTDVYQLRLWIDEEVGNEAQNKSFKARVVINSTQSNASTSDLTPPVITLNGNLSESVEQGEAYTDPGVASVSDDRDSLEISNVKVSYKYFDGETTTSVESIDTSKTGVYYIYYKIKDANENEGKIIRCVNVYKKNTTLPVITLNGQSMITIEKGGTYTELGATAKKEGEDLTSEIVIIGDVDTSEAGVYEIKYTITDRDGNCASIVRIVNVVHMNEDFEENISLDLSSKKTDKINFMGENLGEVTYTSSDESIVRVDEAGNVTAVAPGEVIIHITTSTGVEKKVNVKVVKTVTASYVKGSGIESIGKTSDSCLITSKEESCEVTLPTITVRDGYDSGFWTLDENAPSGYEPGSSIRVSKDEVYYAKAKDLTKPVWSLVSVSPSSSAISSTDQLVILFRGSDTSGFITSTLSKEHITVKAGSTTVDPTMKNLSVESDAVGEKEYRLVLSGIHTDGVISITIASGVLMDEGNNQSIETTFTTGVSVDLDLNDPFYNKKLVILGDQNGATGAQIEAVMNTFPLKVPVVLNVTGNYENNYIGGIDTDIQQQILNTVNEYGPENIVVVLGQPTIDGTKDSAESFVLGDVTYTGPLTGIEFHLPVYHISEDSIKTQVDSNVYRTNIDEGLFELQDIKEVMMGFRREVNDKAFYNKMLVLIGDRDGVTADKMVRIVDNFKYKGIVKIKETECFSCTAAGSMDLDVQKKIKTLTDTYGRENIVVIFGGRDAEAVGQGAEAVTLGDPTFAGPLTGIALHLPVYHILEPEIKKRSYGFLYENEISDQDTYKIDDIVEQLNQYR